MNLTLTMRKFHSLIIAIACLISYSLSASQEFGTASVYSSRFQGGRTANGEIFNHNQFTASHRTLPFGTLIRITRTDNGKSVVVRINDRGPFVSERITDLSKAAASKLHILDENDEIRVKVEVVNDKKTPLGSAQASTNYRPAVLASDRPNTVPMPEPFDKVVSKSIEDNNIPREYHNKGISKKNTPSVSAKSASSTSTLPSMKRIPKDYNKAGVYAVKSTSKSVKQYAIQVASLSSHSNMEKKVAALHDNNFDNVLVNIVNNKDGNPTYKILLGPFESETAATNYLKSLKKKYINGFVVNIKP